MVRIYTKTGDDGTTGLLYGGRVPKWSSAIESNGAVDESQAVLGLVRAESEPGSELHELVTVLERDLWVLMAEVATAPENRRKLTQGTSAVSAAMVEALEARVDDLMDRVEMPSAFVVPGENRISALLDVARTVVRRAERLVAASPPAPGSLAAQYLNRLSDLLWAMARWQENEGRMTVHRPRHERRQALDDAAPGSGGVAGVAVSDRVAGAEAGTGAAAKAGVGSVGADGAGQPAETGETGETDGAAEGAGVAGAAGPSGARGARDKVDDDNGGEQ
ncbi:MAG: cob(I)yrinic acid a,c-diamide adenosyltransferase [Actinomycetota bacterium]|nr:cob(I)yrinic acid a,c-diamide adenosyltransferase [Actinomycetota bacterium]